MQRALEATQQAAQGRSGTPVSEFLGEETVWLRAAVEAE
ncbi:hypothetical protein HALLA_04045 (plasmid) [Halostagnicola larsenii XH-48]|uniref:Uncharacterized protein n=1 Tax=Halostagnicola larsenii XH-48 TaxID=797299 RepID=W0JSA7_9EURY|nr:hypothetical protein HALLA_04045 [Halostagnicola larsenii XH-48]